MFTCVQTDASLFQCYSTVTGNSSLCQNIVAYNEFEVIAEREISVKFGLFDLDKTVLVAGESVRVCVCVCVLL